MQYKSVDIDFETVIDVLVGKFILNSNIIIPIVMIFLMKFMNMGGK